MIINKEECDIDVTNGEVASVSGATKGKYYNDALKLALSTKQHLNHIISVLPHLDPKDLLKLKIPVVQILGMNCHVGCVQIIDKGVYIIQDVYSFNYPKTIKEINNGAIGKIITGLTLIKDMMTDVGDIYSNSNKTNSDNIDDVKRDKKQKYPLKLNKLYATMLNDVLSMMKIIRLI